jgi:hypothetical protein
MCRQRAVPQHTCGYVRSIRLPHAAAMQEQGRQPAAKSHTCQRLRASCSATSRPSLVQGSRLGAALKRGRITAAAAAPAAAFAAPAAAAAAPPQLLPALPCWLAGSSADDVRRCQRCWRGDSLLLPTLWLGGPCHTTAASNASQAARCSASEAISCLQQPSMLRCTCACTHPHTCARPLRPGLKEGCAAPTPATGHCCCCCSPFALPV